MAEIRVKGLSDLNAYLQAFPVKLEANILRGALRAGLKPVKDDAAANCPDGEPSETNKRKYKLYRGALRDSLRISARLRKKEGKVIATLYAGGKSKKTGADVFYAHIIELTGARAHSLTKGGKGTTIHHPGVVARPYLRPAIDAQSNNAILATANYIRNRLQTKHGIDTSDIQIGIDE